MSALAEGYEVHGAPGRYRAGLPFPDRETMDEAKADTQAHRDRILDHHSAVQAEGRARARAEADKVAHSITAEAWHAWAALTFDTWTAEHVELAASAGIAVIADREWRFTPDGAQLDQVLLEAWESLKESELPYFSFDSVGRWMTVSAKPTPDGIRGSFVRRGFVTPHGNWTAFGKAVFLWGARIAMRRHGLRHKPGEYARAMGV